VKFNFQVQIKCDRALAQRRQGTSKSLALLLLDGFEDREKISFYFLFR
jgi:hypothetical protein